MADVNRDWLTRVEDLVFTGVVAMLYDDSVGVRSSFTFADADVTGNVITSTTHGLPNTARVRFTAGTGALPSPLVAGQDYYVILLTANTFSLASTIAEARASTTIVLTPAGGGTGHTCDEQIIDGALSSPEHAIAREIANANGYVRQAVTLTGAFDTGADNRMELEDMTVEFGPASGGGFSYTGVAWLTQSSTTYGATGRMYTSNPEGTTTVVPAPQTKPFRFATNLMNRNFTDQGV